MVRLKELGLTTPEESQHQLDIVQVCKIVKGVGGVNSEHWFKMVENARMTRRWDPLNIQSCRAKNLENFFLSQSARSMKQCASIRQALTAQAFTKAYKDHRRQMVAFSRRKRCHGERQ
jgi:hypothetical protein